MLRIFLLSILVGGFGLSHAQKVGLVLSGGAAKGLAHVGVLKALEENNIPVDVIVGTSMGGIIGGMYASGFSALEIEQLVKSAEFQQWVSGRVNDKLYYYYSKKDDNPSWITVQLSLDSTLHTNLNTSLANDLSLNFILAEYLAPPSAAAQYDFDHLMKPFRAVASEIFTQQEVILKSGSLNNALRATLSVPVFYKPIKIDGKYLFDGGLYNNFPVDVAQRDFSPDVIIGVNVSAQLFEEYPYDKDSRLINNLLYYMLLDKADPKKVPENGVYIAPQMEGYTGLDFRKVDALIDSGYVQTLRQMPEIKEKIDRRESAEEARVAREKFTSSFRPLEFSGIEFHGFNSRQKKYLTRVLGFKGLSDPLPIEELKRGFFQLTSEKYFSNIYPNFILNEAGDAYLLELHRRPQNNLNLDIGGAIASRNISQIFLGIDHYHFDNYLLNNTANFYSGNFYKSIQVRSRWHVPSFKVFYIEPEFTLNNWDYLNTSDFFLRDISPSFVQRTDRKTGVNLGFPLGNRFKIEGSISHINNFDRFANTRQVLSTDTLDWLKLQGTKVGLNISRNNLNKKQFANGGNLFYLHAYYFDIAERHRAGSTSIIEEGTLTGNQHQWLQLKLNIEQYFKNNRWSYGYLIESVFSNQPVFTNYYASLVSAPAFSPIYESRTRFLPNFRSFNYVGGGLRAIYSLHPTFDIRCEGYAFKSLDGITEGANQSPVYGNLLGPTRLAASGTLVFHSPVGPLAFGVNYYDDSNPWSVMVHLGYILFNKSSME
jgi:NTE family protein